MAVVGQSLRSVWYSLSRDPGRDAISRSQTRHTNRLRLRHGSRSESDVQS